MGSWRIYQLLSRPVFLHARAPQVPPTTNHPFKVDGAIVIKPTSISLTEPHENGRLFVVDHEYQADCLIAVGRCTAAYNRLFHISSRDKNILPLAIKTTVDSNLLYTPLDSESEWLLAKTTFTKPISTRAIHHLLAAHGVSKILHEAVQSSNDIPYAFIIYAKT